MTQVLSFKAVIFIVPLAVRTDSVVGDGSKDKRRQGERSGGGGRSKKDNSIPWPLLAVFGTLLLVGIDEVQKNIFCISIGYYHAPIQGGYTPLTIYPRHSRG